MHNIIVRDVKELEQYYARLKDAKESVEKLLEKLRDDCRDQERNWEDDQYRVFEEKLTEFIDSVDNVMKDELKEAMQVVEGVLKRLQ